MLTVDTATSGARSQGGKTYGKEAPRLGVEQILDVLGEAIAVYE
ncbi:MULTISPECIES: hypothetical protein [unclassified Moorena]|nr:MULTISPECIES: hypothetical protein [unclassified Moorena]